MPPPAELLPPWLPPALAERILLALAGVLAIWLAARLVRHSLSRWIGDAATRYRARKMVNAVALAAGLVFVAFVLVDRLTGLGVTLGLVGAGMALALQQPLLSLAGWLALAFGGYYRAGHRVQVGDVVGDVIDVGLLRTTIFEVGGAAPAVSGYSGRVVRVANSAVLTEPVYNYSGDFPFLWDGIDVPIRHGSDRAAARALLEEAVAEIVGDYVPEAQATWRRLRRRYRLSEANVDPDVRMVADENWLTFSVRYVVDYRRRPAVRDALWNRALDAIDAAEDVELATASQEVTVAPDSAITVRGGTSPGHDEEDVPRGGGREGEGRGVDDEPPPEAPRDV